MINGANFTRHDYYIMELGHRVIWCMWTENTGLPEVRQLTIKSRFRSVD